MTYQFRKAIRQNVSVIVALAGGTGSGKTKSAFELATGLADGKPFAVIDTENGRARHYAPKLGEKADRINTYDFEHVDLVAPFTPAAYAEAIKAADAAGFPVIVVDSASHEHAGDGGLLDMHEAELTRMAGDDWAKRDRVKMAAWIKPKGEHKRMMQTLLQVKAHIILCFRAEEKIEIAKVDGKLVVQPKKSRTGKDGWVPICEKNIPFEATCSFLLIDEAPGMPKPIKLQEQHKAFFPLDRPISQEAGKQLAVWAAGATITQVASESADGLASGMESNQAGGKPATNSDYITADMHIDILDKLKAVRDGEKRLKYAAKVDSLTKIPRANYARTLAWIEQAAK